MANNCSFDLKAVARDRAALERLVRILDYRDYGADGAGEGLHLRRIFSSYCPEGVKGPDENGLYHAVVLGSCAWSALSCMGDAPGSLYDTTDKDPTHSVFRWSPDEPVRFANVVTSLPALCSRLGLAVELWASEPGVGFQEHWTIRQTADGVEDDGGSVTDWSLDWDAPAENVCESGGFDGFGEFRENAELFSGKETA